ncbi:3-phytase [Prauserella marina]|uniref:3-phytase n=2 Tax=Prauserella marina TaxID=530584 RepID=A0A222VT93_9PSEU|nr:3-phytase [Prauserella marina]SDD80154.1 3-phytase [Prauserella marina]
MVRFMTSSFAPAFVAALMTATTALTPATAEAAEQPVRLLGEAIIPHKMDYEGTTVGGLSGIDRDPCTGEYVMISDDRSYQQPARFYTAAIDVDAAGVHGVDISGTHALRQPDGATYPSPTAKDGKAVDPEEIRVDPWNCQYWWSQEGNRPKDLASDEPLIQPSIQASTRHGGYLRSLPLPADYTITRDEQGPRRNLVLEAITFDRGGATLTSAVEGPLVQDGEEPTTEQGALTRVTTQSRSGEVLAQYAYPLDPLFAEADPTSPWSPDTGVPAILADPDEPGRYLVLERTYVPGAGFGVKIFTADVRGATDTRGTRSLATVGIQPMHKEPLVDLADLPLSTVDNVEGMTWGPDLPSGERTLVLVSDDNFAEEEVSQVIALAVG